MKAKTIISLSLLSAFCILCSTASVRAQQPFEGTATYSMKISQLGPEAHDLVMNIKGDKNKVEIKGMPMGAMTVYRVPAEQKTYMVMGNQGMVLSDQDAATMRASVGADTSVPTLVATGKTEKIGGHPSQEFTASFPDGHTLALWGSTDFPPSLIQSFLQSMKTNRSFGNSDNGVMKQLADKGMGVTRMVLTNAGNTFSMDLKSLVEHHMEDKDFVPPTNIKYMDQSKMMKNMGHPSPGK